jgi:hypothetical protein
MLQLFCVLEGVKLASAHVATCAAGNAVDVPPTTEEITKSTGELPILNVQFNVADTSVTLAKVTANVVLENCVTTTTSGEMMGRPLGAPFLARTAK